MQNFCSENTKAFVKIFIVIISIGLMLPVFLLSKPSVSQASAIAPALPQTYLDSSYPTLSPSRTVWSVKNSCGQISHCSSSLQSVIDQAVLGDEIVIDAGMQITGPIILRNKTTGSGWIVIRTANLSSLPPAGTRVGPADAVNMPKILAPGSNVAALQTDPSAHNYRIVGIEFAKATPAAVTDTLILAGDGSSAQNTMSLVPHDLVFDRIYAHGDPTSDLKRGLGLNSASTSIVDSYISEIHEVGVDTQAIAGWNGPGPFKIVNNFLEGAAENVLFGGSDPFIQNLVSSDIVFDNNYVYKPQSWRVGDPSYTGHHWEVKNIFELKNVQRLEASGNIFDGNWLDGQSGFSIVFTPRNQDGTCTWCVVQDVTFQNNIIRHVGAGLNMLGHDNENLSQLTQRIKVYNNIWDDVNGATYNGSSGIFAQFITGTNQNGPSDVSITHNTVMQTGTFVVADGYSDGTHFYTKPDTVITDNLASHNSYGVIGDSEGIGDSTLTDYFPGISFTKNILMGGPANSYTQHPGNYFPSSWSGVLVNQAGGDYHIVSTSIYHNAATDGTDIGANINAVTAATANTVTGGGNSTSPSPAPSPTPTPTPTPTPPADTTKPVVTLFDVEPRTGSASVTATFTTTDTGGSFLASEELLRANSNSTNCLVGNISGCSWSHIQSINAPASVNTWNGSFIDTPGVGNYLYGTHSHDGAGNIGFEPAIIAVTVTAAQTPIVGDINADHIVNSVDYSILNAHWFSNYAAADFNQDGIINAIDYSMLNANWFKTW